MNWSALSFLANPWFVSCWYAVGAIGAVAVAFDLGHSNTPLKQAMKWAWPIIVFFFSVIGLVLYWGTARAPGIGTKSGQAEKMRAHANFEKKMFRRVNGAVIHCVAGDGLGIMSAMVIARLAGMSFWQEFWFEYIVGFSFGWFIFQLKSMKMMTDDTGEALLMAFRGEFFSMLTVMGGMGAVMAYVTPMAVTQQPKPWTFAFWGFGMLGLLVGYVATFPMNWMLVKIGWKHGMGPMDDAPLPPGKEQRGGYLAAMGALGIVALSTPAVLMEVRTANFDWSTRSIATSPQPLQASVANLSDELDMASAGIFGRQRGEATAAMEAAHRAAEVLHAAFPDPFLGEVVLHVKRARQRLQMDDPQGATRELDDAAEALHGLHLNASAQVPDVDPRPYVGAVVVDDRGREVGEVVSIERNELLVASGARDIFGLFDGAPPHGLQAVVGDFLLGPKRTVGSSLVMVVPSAAGSAAEVASSGIDARSAP